MSKGVFESLSQCISLSIYVNTEHFGCLVVTCCPRARDQIPGIFKAKAGTGLQSFDGKTSI